MPAVEKVHVQAHTKKGNVKISKKNSIQFKRCWNTRKKLKTEEYYNLQKKVAYE